MNGGAQESGLSPRQLLQALGAGVILKLLFKALFGGLLLALVGAFTYAQIPALPEGIGWSLLSVLLALLLVVLYGALGLAAGTALGLATAVHRFMDRVEGGLARLLTPVAGTVTRRLQLGEAGLTPEQFKAELERVAQNLKQEQKGRGGLLSPAAAFSRLLFRFLLWLVRLVYTREFLKEVGPDGRVTHDRLERFAGSRLAELATMLVRDQIDLLRWVVYGLGALLCAVPIGLALS